MKLVNLQTKQYEDVPDEQVGKAFSAGTHGFASPDDQVPMQAPDGSFYKVAAKDFAQASQEGATVANHQEFRKAELEEKYGGFGGGAAAFGEGAARGATLGISDKVAIEAARAFGGEETAQHVRTHLAEEKEARPWLAGGGEVLGAAAPLLASGGAAAPLEGAELARAGAGLVEAGETAAAASKGAGIADRMGSLLRAVGAPARGVGAAGDAAESVAGRMLELAMGAPGGEGAAARIMRTAVKAGFRGGAEGAAFGAANEWDESVLGDHELNAEKLVAALGHGALYGAMTGVGLGAAGGVAKEAFGAVLNRVGPSLERQADVQMWKALSPLKKYTNEAEARAGGAAAVGRTLRDELQLGDNPFKAALTAEELAPKIDQALQRKWGQMSDLMAQTGGEVGGQRIVAAVDDVIAPLRKKAGFEPIVRSLEEYRASLADKLGIKLEDTAAAKGATGAREAFAKQMGITLEEFDSSRAPAVVAARKGFEATPAGQAGAKAAGGATDRVIPVAELMEQRKALQDLVYKEAKALDPGMRVEALREVRGKLADLELEAVDEAAKKAGREGAGEELRKLRTDYQRLRIAQDAVEDTTSRMATNRNLSLSDYMVGGAHAAGALAAGHPLVAAGAIATSFAHKAIRERGNAAAAVALGRLAKLDLIARATQKVDSELEGAVRAFVREEKAPPKLRARHFGTSADQDVQDRYQEAEARKPVNPPQLTPEHFEKALPGFGEHAPKTAGAALKVIQQTAAYRAAQRPQPTTPPDPFGGPPRVSDQAAAMAVRKDDAARDPVGTIVRGLAANKLHKDQIDAIKQTSPKLLAQVQQQVLEEASKHPKKMSYEKKVTASILTGVPLHPTLTGPAVASFQRTFAPGAGLGGAVQPPGGGTPRAPKRMVKGFSTDTALSAGRTGGL